MNDIIKLTNTHTHTQTNMHELSLLTDTPVFLRL